jgi:hypothetical protein
MRAPRACVPRLVEGDEASATTEGGAPVKRREERPPLTFTADAAANVFPDGLCLQCGKGAWRFTSAEVPELLKFLAGEIGERHLAAAARRTFPEVGTCMVAPLAGVSICASKWVTP